jgi:hypothetical protein
LFLIEFSFLHDTIEELEHTKGCALPANRRNYEVRKSDVSLYSFISGLPAQQGGNYEKVKIINQQKEY